MTSSITSKITNRRVFMLQAVAGSGALALASAAQAQAMVSETDPAASGLAYKAIKEGTGATPGPEDVVEVHYHGTLQDGTVFDSSVERGQTISFPLNRVIKGWTEGLQLMTPGARCKLVIPGPIAYGEQGRQPKIPANATLVFDVELLKITRMPKLRPATMMSPGRQRVWKPGSVSSNRCGTISAAAMCRPVTIQPGTTPPWCGMSWPSTQARPRSRQS
jgi:FKBP-type peptidyl-prolyl cis-trans isomerase